MACASRPQNQCSASSDQSWDSASSCCAVSTVFAANGASSPWPGTSRECLRSAMAERRAAVCLKTANRTDPRSKYPQPTRNHSQYDNHYESFGSIIPRPRRQPPLQAKYKPKSDRLLGSYEGTEHRTTMQAFRFSAEL